jgi:parvulin-like peptidyl-prolyl isomerase
MKHRLTLIIFFVTSLVVSGFGMVSGQDLPVIKGKKVVATVTGEPITMDEFNRDLALSHEKSKLELLRRLINARLIIQEAKRIGLDELPEIKNMVDAFSKVTLREGLMERQVRNIKADDREVEKLYKESVKEWKISSVLVEKENDAKMMLEGIKGGKNFDELSKQIVAERKAKRGEQAEWLKVKDIDPQIVNVVSKMKVGSVSSIIPIKTGCVILRLEDIRYSEDPEAMKQAREEALKGRKVQALKDYSKALIKKYARVNQDILNTLNYEAKTPGFEALLKDKRAVAEIKGEDPITVGELTQHFKMQFFHGVERAIESKRLNSKKASTLEEMIFKRVFRKEALRLGLEKTERYKNRVQEYETSVLFGTFINKVIVPDIKLKEEEIKSYYKDHIQEYTMPEMMKINTLVFAKREDGESAIEKLRKGTEFQWLAAHAEGQLDQHTKGLLTFDEKPIVTKDLPEGVQKAIHGARAGNFRLYESPQGYFYVFAIRDVIPSKPQSFEEARGMVVKKVFDDKTKKALEDYADKLRAVSDVKVYLKDN